MCEVFLLENGPLPRKVGHDAQHIEGRQLLLALMRAKLLGYVHRFRDGNDALEHKLLDASAVFNL